MVQSPFADLARPCIDVRYLLHAGVIIHSYKDHVRLLLPNLPSSILRRITNAACSRHCYEMKCLRGEVYPSRIVHRYVPGIRSSFEQICEKLSQEN